jgi:quercetin dioxygenase-like cupin family protein
MFNRRDFVSCAIYATIGLASSQGDADAQSSPGLSRKILNKTEYPGDKYVCILLQVDFDPEGLAARHTHPGVESGYLVSGSSTLSVRGQPDRILKAGDGYQIPPETPHSIRNGPDKSTIIITVVVEKDKPLTSPAPE